MKTINDKFERFVRELNSLNQNLSKLVDYGLGPEQITIQVFPGASESEIIGVERDLRAVLPNSFKLFLTNWNGATLYEGKYRPSTKVFGTKEIVKRNLIWKEQELYSDEWIPGFVIFAAWNNGDYFVFDTSQLDATGECPVFDGDHNYLPEGWKVICPSFDEWLTRFIEDQGGMFWLKK